MESVMKDNIMSFIPNRIVGSVCQPVKVHPCIDLFEDGKNKILWGGRFQDIIRDRLKRQGDLEGYNEDGGDYDMEDIEEGYEDLAEDGVDYDYGWDGDIIAESDMEQESDNDNDIRGAWQDDNDGW